MKGKGIHIYGLHKSFGKNEVLKGIDLKFDRPGITAVLGPNGAGKTTMIKCVLGMVIPDRGTIVYDDKPVNRKWQYRDQIDYLPQIVRFPENLRVNELFNLLLDLRKRESRHWQYIEYFELHPWLDKKLKQLSGGTRQKVNIVQALMYDNPVIILDEPTAGLDPVARIQFKKLLQEEKKRGKIILLNTHVMSLVEDMADNIVFLLDGKVHFEGSQEELNEKTGEGELERSIATLMKKKLGIAPKLDEKGPILRQLFGR